MPSKRLAKRELLAYLAVLALIAFWPSPVDAPAAGLLARVLRKLHSWGAPPWINYDLAESVANILLFVPLGVLLVWILGRSYWWVAAPAALITSGAIEVGQFLFLPARFPTFSDVIANTAGGVLGGALSYLLWHKIGPGARRLPALQPDRGNARPDRSAP